MSNFDGWRHVYFVYPLIIINSIYFLNKINQNNLLYFKILLIILSINILLNLQWIFKNHPFQYTYFNILNDFNKSKGFDYDYHGVSNYNAFLFIYSDSNKSKSTVGTISYNNLSANHQILPNQIKNSIEITSIENGLPNYLIDNYRIPYKKEKTIFLKEKLENYSKIKDFKVDRNIISTIYKKK